MSSVTSIVWLEKTQVRICTCIAALKFYLQSIGVIVLFIIVYPNEENRQPLTRRNVIRLSQIFQFEMLAAN